MRPPGWWAARCATSSGARRRGSWTWRCRGRARAGAAARRPPGRGLHRPRRSARRLPAGGPGRRSTSRTSARRPSRRDLGARDFTVNALARAAAALARGRRARPVTDPDRRPGRSRGAARPPLRAGRARRRSRARPARGAARPAAGMAARRAASRPPRAPPRPPWPAWRRSGCATSWCAMLEGPRAGQGLRLLDDLGAARGAAAGERAPCAPPPSPSPITSTSGSIRCARSRRPTRLLARAGGRDFAPDLVGAPRRGPRRRPHPAGHAQARRAPPRRGQARDAHRDGRARAIHRPRRHRAPRARSRWRSACASRAAPPRWSSAWCAITCDPCIWPRPARSRAARAIASSATSAPSGRDLLLLALADAAALRGDPPLEIWGGRGAGGCSAR